MTQSDGPPTKPVGGMLVAQPTTTDQHVCSSIACNNVAVRVVDGWRVCASCVDGERKPSARRVEQKIPAAVTGQRSEVTHALTESQASPADPCVTGLAGQPNAESLVGTWRKHYANDAPSRVVRVNGVDDTGRLMFSSLFGDKHRLPVEDVMRFSVPASPREVLDAKLATLTPEQRARVTYDIHVAKRDTSAVFVDHASVWYGGFAWWDGTQAIDADAYGAGIDAMLAALDAALSKPAPVAERPAVGSVHPWDVARADMEAHPEARWSVALIDDDQPHRFRNGRREYLHSGRWEAGVADHLGAIDCMWTRLPDEPEKSTAAEVDAASEPHKSEAGTTRPRDPVDGDFAHDLLVKLEAAYTKLYAVTAERDNFSCNYLITLADNKALVDSLVDACTERDELRGKVTPTTPCDFCERLSIDGMCDACKANLVRCNEELIKRTIAERDQWQTAHESAVRANKRLMAERNGYADDARGAESERDRWAARNAELERRLEAIRDVSSGRKIEALLWLGDPLLLTLQRATEAWGVESRPVKLTEECGELITAIAQRSIGRASVDDVLEEVADVMLCALNVALVEGIDKFNGAMSRKLDKLQTAIDVAKGGA